MLNGIYLDQMTKKKKKIQISVFLKCKFFYEFYFSSSQMY